MANIIKGDTVTVSLVFPSTYDPLRIENIVVALRGVEVASLQDGRVVQDIDPRIFYVKLTSDYTRQLSGAIPVTVIVADTELRIKHCKTAYLHFQDSLFTIADSTTSNVVDVVLNIDITSASQTIDVYLASVMRGYSAYEIDKQNGFVGSSQDWSNSIARKKVVQVADVASGDVITHNLGGTVLGVFVDDQGVVDDNVKFRKNDNNTVVVILPILDGILNNTITGTCVFFKLF